jgi:hypothetical protein
MTYHDKDEIIKQSPSCVDIVLVFVRDGATFSLLEVVKYRWRVFNLFVGRIGDDSFRFCYCC